MPVQCPTCGDDEHLLGWPDLDDGRRPTECNACGQQWLRDPPPDWRPSHKPLVFVSTSDLDTDAIREAAWRIAQERRDQGLDVPLRDLILRHGIGLYGGHAVARYLTEAGLTVRNIGENWQAIQERLGDIEVVTAIGRSPVRIEVKCTTPGGVLAKIPPMRADAAVWCIVGLSAQTVRLRGWSPLPVDNPLSPLIREASDLVPWIRDQR